MADSDLAELRKQCITSLYLCTENVSKYLDCEKNNEFTKLKKYVEQYCILEAQEKVAIEALEKAKNETDSTNNHIQDLEDRVAIHLSNLAGKQLNVESHPYMRELNKRIEKSFQRTTDNLDESDLAITESQDRHIDPITKKPIEDPVKNTVCGHIYEKEAILNMISRKPRARCPVAGCGNRGPLLAEHMVSDEELKFRMALTQHSTMIQDRSIMDLDASQE